MRLASPRPVSGPRLTTTTDIRLRRSFTTTQAEAGSGNTSMSRLSPPDAGPLQSGARLPQRGGAGRFLACDCGHTRLGRVRDRVRRARGGPADPHGAGRPARKPDAAAVIGGAPAGEQRWGFGRLTPAGPSAHSLL